MADEVNEETVLDTETTELTVEAATEAGFTEQEIVMATKRGMIKKEEEDTDKDTDKDDSGEDEDNDEDDDGVVIEKKVVEKEETKEEKKEKRAQVKSVKEKVLNGDDLEPEEEDLVHQELSKEEKGFYFKGKKERQKRQLIEKQKELLQAQVDSMKEEMANLKARVIDEDEEDLEYMTKAEAEEYYASKRKEEDSQGSLEQKQVEIKQQALDIVEAETAVKDPSFPAISQAFLKVASEDQVVLKAFQTRFQKIGSDPEAEYDLIDYVYRTVDRKGIKIDEGDIESNSKGSKAAKVLNNSKKRKSSASVNSNSKSIISEDDLTEADVATMSPGKWSSLKQNTKDRLLGKPQH